MPADPAVAQQTVIGLLGPVSVDGVEVAGVRAKRLLTSLALAGGRARTADRLIDDVWGDSPPKSPHAALHTQISRLRQVLGEATILGVGSGYRLNGVVTDVELVESSLAGGDSDAVDRAVEQWRGQPGEDLGADDDLARTLRRRADRAWARVEELRGAQALAVGDFATARHVAEQRCAADPLDEQAHVLLMRALAADGRRADALAVFARLRRSLATELGVDPGPQAAALNVELLADERSVDEQAPRAGRAGRAVGLRAESTPLIGRDDDLAGIVDLLDAHRVVTILGPGGVGKTRMANAVGNELAAQGRTVFFVPLASVRDNADVVAVLAGALGVGETDLSVGARPRIAVGELADRLADAVRGQQAVLILDNCEQVIDACAGVIDGLIAAEPRLVVVTTSRSPLLIAAEQVYPLPVLGVDGADSSAVELFGMRARAVRPTADLPMDKVADLCAHLDGLPLAIELAAARIRVMTVDEILARLTARFDLLRSADRTRPDRHRTLHAVIEWSWDLLDDDARTALRSLCRFPAGFRTSAAGAVLRRSGPELDDVLDSLVNQSLLEVSEVAGHARYRMLEMVREFGEEKLAESGDGARIDAAMASWATDFTRSTRQRYEQSADREMLLSLAAEVENLVWVLRRCTSGAPDTETIVSVFPAVATIWAMQGLHAEVRSWGVRILDVLPTPPTDPDDDARERWQLTVLLACVHLLVMPQLRPLATARYYLRRLARAELCTELPAEFLSALLLSRSPFGALRVLVDGTASTNPDVRRAALSIRMNLRENNANLDGALADHLEVSKMAKHSDPWLQSMSDVSTASIFGQRKDWATAVSLYRSGVANLAVIGAVEDEAQARSYLVITLLALGEFDEAQRELDVLADGWTLDDPDPQGNPEAVAGMMVCFAESARLRGEPSAGVFVRAGELLVREHPVITSDPGVGMVLGAIVIGLALTGASATAEPFAGVLAEGVAHSFSALGWHDLPQAGVTALAIGLLLAGDPKTAIAGATLFAIADKLKARQDFPVLVEALARRREFAVVDDATWERIQLGVGRMSRRQAIVELRNVLADNVR
ncbi:ATP-binding protein [Gordonia sp. TBRC 11910]|uniref:ATP-binding protein n=1 Tax=Gordonia asplenii TaxID=2725283 RepID=A0A848KUW8_9ACTN|nr:BTAD domain-containing putative transcriptional regulator [Gordonia asplenii]NMO02330.1 ATP-binding protein [Gordonia asplenii]